MIAGEFNLKVDDATEQILSVAKIIVHPKYKPPLNDIAILRLADPVEFNDAAQPVELATVDVPDNTMCVTTGWGFTKGGYKRQVGSK